MNSSITVIRAVAGEIASRIYLPTLIVALTITGVLVGLVAWLATMNLWWLLLGIPVLLAIVIGGTILIIVRIIIATAIPTQTKTQRQKVKEFTNKLLAASEITQTPKFILLFRVVKDVLRPKGSSYVESVVSDTLALRMDFNELRRSFE